MNWHASHEMDLVLRWGSKAGIVKSIDEKVCRAGMPLPCYYKGRYFSEWKTNVEELKRDEKLDECEACLKSLIEWCRVW